MKTKQKEITVKDSEGNVLYHCRQPVDKQMKVPIGKLMMLYQRSSKIKTCSLNVNVFTLDE